MPTPKRTVRISDALWKAFGERARKLHMNPSELTRMLMGLVVNTELRIGEVPKPAVPQTIDREEL